MILGLQKLADFMANAFFNYKEGPVIYLNLALNNAEALLRAHEFSELAHRINGEILGMPKRHTYRFLITTNLKLLVAC